VVWKNIYVAYKLEYLNYTLRGNTKRAIVRSIEGIENNDI
jgi:hypothetical protein